MNKPALLISSFAVLAGLLAVAQDKEKPGFAVTNHDSTSWTVQLPADRVTTGQIAVMQSPNQILAVTGLPRTEVAISGSMFLAQEKYFRPDKPEEVKVVLWTSDGRKWVAKWEEVKQ